MSASRELALASGLLALDDDVVEAFGFTTGTSQRIPLSALDRLELNRTILTIGCSGHNILPISASLTKDEAASDELARLLDAIRTAAPGLEG